MKLLLLLLLLAALESSALKLECLTDDDPFNCSIANIPNPLNEPVEFSNMNPLVAKLTIQDCSTSAIPANLFVNYSKISLFRVFDSSNLKQLGAGP